MALSTDDLFMQVVRVAQCSCYDAELILNLTGASIARPRHPRACTTHDNSAKLAIAEAYNARLAPGSSAARRKKKANS
eukprot:scaffold233558_cov31-Tisochrysis_lutea.AAC.1